MVSYDSFHSLLPLRKRSLVVPFGFQLVRDSRLEKKFLISENELLVWFTLVFYGVYHEMSPYFKNNSFWNCFQKWSYCTETLFLSNKIEIWIYFPAFLLNILPRWNQTWKSIFFERTHRIKNIKLLLKINKDERIKT